MKHGTEEKYIPGNRYIECDVCGFTYRFSAMKKGIAEGQRGWNVCPADYDPVHPRERRVKLTPKQPTKDVGD